MAQLDIDTANDVHDAEQSFIESVAAKYQAEDDAADKAADEAASGDDSEDEEAQDEQGADADDSDDADEHTDSDTSSDDPDGDDAEPDEDSDEGDAEDHPEEDDSEESEDGDDVEEEDAADDSSEDDDDEEPSEEFQAAAKRLNIPLTLEDIEDETARRLVKQKLKGMDAAFTRGMQDLRAYRQDEVRFRAEEQFRKENPDLVIAELLQAGGEELFDKVNARMAKLTDEDSQAAFKIIVDDKRKKAATAIESQIAEGQKLVERADHVETLAKRVAQKAGLPWEFAESAVERALLRKPADKRDLTDEEIREAVKAEADNYQRHVRAHRREASKKTIQERTANRRTTPGTKAPAAAASPKPGAKKKATIDYSNEDSRRAPMHDLARKLFPGAKDE